MGIDFNNVRKLAVKDYNQLVSALITNLGGEFYQDHMCEVRNALDELKMKLSAIASSYLEGDPEFRDLTDEIKFTQFHDEKH